MNTFALLRRPPTRRLLVGLLGGLAGWLLSLLGPVHELQEQLFDQYVRWRGTRPTQARVVLVTLEDVDLDRLDGPAIFLSPALADVVTSLKREGAKAIGLDLIVPESLSARPELAEGGPGDATRLGGAIQQAGNVVLAKRMLPDGRWLLPLDQWQFKANTEPDPRGTDLGFVDLTEDADHVVRRQQLLEPGGNLHFALALYLVAHGGEIAWQQGLRVNGRPVPLDASQRLRIHFMGPPGSFPRIPFADALDAARRGQRQRLDVRDAIVIIGATSPSQQDYHATPYAGLMAGPEVHAGILATLTDAAYLSTPPGLAPLPLACLWGSFLALALPRLRLAWGAAVVVAGAGVVLILSLLAFRTLNWRVESIPPVLAGFLVYPAILTMDLIFRSQKELDRRIGSLVPEVDAQIRTELHHALRTLRSGDNPQGVILMMSRLSLLLLDKLFALCHEKRPSDNLFHCILRLSTGSDKDPKIRGLGVLPRPMAENLDIDRCWANPIDHAQPVPPPTHHDAENALNLYLRVLEWFHCECPLNPHRSRTIYSDPDLAGNVGKAAEQSPE